MDVDSILDFDPSAAKERLCDTMDASMIMGELGSGESFQLPNMDKAEAFARTKFEAADSPADLKFAHGTTTLGFVFKHGVVIAVDSRSTQGPYIASQSVKKVLRITPYLLGTMAGGAADCQFWERELGRRCRLYELRNKKRITVAAASKILGNITYAYKGYGLSMGTMIAGWDHTGPNLHYVDSDGTRLKGQRFSVGSGSTYAYGVLDTGFRYDMEIEEACELGRRAIHHATHRDAYSGGIINVFLVQEEGWKKISADDTNDLFYERYKKTTMEPFVSRIFDIARPFRSPLTCGGFPVANRPTEVQNVGAMGLHLRRRRDRQEPFLTTISDLHLLLFLGGNLLDMGVDMPVLCSKIAEGKADELDGFQMMVNCYAGIE